MITRRLDDSFSRRQFHFLRCHSKILSLFLIASLCPVVRRGFMLSVMSKFDFFMRRETVAFKRNDSFPHQKLSIKTHRRLPFFVSLSTKMKLIKYGSFYYSLRLSGNEQFLASRRHIVILLGRLFIRQIIILVSFFFTNFIRKGLNVS